MTTSSRITSGSLLIAVPAVFMAGFTGLQMSFGYPDILRHPAGEVLTRFAAGGADLHVYWYAMFASAIALIASAIATGVLLWERDRTLAALSIGFGALAGLVQALGLLRWVILVPALATSYTAPGASEAGQATTAALFDFANQYLGAGVGEHMGYLLTAVWTVLVSLLVLRDHRFLAAGGLVTAAAVAYGLGEPFGLPMAGPVVAIGFTVWAVWALLLGVQVLRDGRVPAISARVAA